MTEQPHGSAGDSYTNIAQDANVETQIGVVRGNVNFYKMAEATSSPAEKYEIGRRYLDGNMPRQAETLIREAFFAGFRSNQVSYYWALAVLSGRPFDHLADNEFDQLDNAFSAIENDEGDEWLRPLTAVFRLVRSVNQQEEAPDADPERFASALDLYRALPPDRRAEIRRHLEMILVGGIQDRLDAQDAVEVEQRRMANGRRDRAWKFFEQDPVPARKLDVPTTGAQDGSGGLLLGCGVVLGLACWFFGASALVGGSVAVFVLALLMYAGGVYLLVRYGLERRALAVALKWSDARFQYASTTNYPNSTWSTDEALVAAGVRRLIEFRFARQNPSEEDARARWLADTGPLRETLIHEVSRQYADIDPRRIGGIDWLARTQAEKAFADWQRGALYADRAELIPSSMTTRFHVAGVAAVVASLVVLAANAAQGKGFLGVLAVVGWSAATALMWNGGASVRERSALVSHRDAVVERRLLAENKAFAEWRKELEDAPSDTELATWLDDDKAFVKSLAMRHYRLTNRDLIAHVILAGPALVSLAARVPYGPPRYSNYEVQLFLLTDYGVRQYSVQLNLLNGAITNEQRRVFQYDSISSAEVAEVGVRVNGAKREIVRPNEAPHPSGGLLDKLVFSQEFRLTLNNTQSVHMLVGNLDPGLVERVMEDPRYLFELAMDTSGVTAAVRILEAIAAEGDHWVAQERLRRRRRILEYQRKRGGYAAIAAGSEAPTPPLGIARVRRQLE